MLIIIVFALIVMLIIGAPVIFAIGSAAMIYFLSPETWSLVSVYPQRFFMGMNSFTFLCIPMFVFSGEIMNHSGMMDDLVRFAQMLVGRLRGGLAHVNVLASMMFGGVTGSGLADVSALGPIEIRMMKDDGYDGAFAAALTATSAIQGPIIPPSIAMVLFASLTNASVGALFMGGVLPGVMIGLGQMLVIVLLSKKMNFPKRDYKFTVREIVSSTKQAFFAFMMPVIILGGIISGIFTATEAAAVAAGYSFCVALFIYRSVTFQSLRTALANTVQTSAAVYLIIGFVYCISWVLAAEQFPVIIQNFVSAKQFTAYTLLFYINLFLLFNGCWLSDTAQLVLFAPLFTPILQSMGVHPVHFGVVMVVNTMIGMITPPYGMALYLAAAIAKEPLRKVVKMTLPFTAVSIIVLFIVTYFPSLVLFLPRFFKLI